MYYWYEGDAAVESVKKRMLDGDKATADDGDGASMGVIFPHTYGYVSSMALIGHLVRPSEWLAGGIMHLLRLAHIADY